MKRYIARLLPPVIFVLMLPIALAAVSNDRADNSFTFSYDAEANTITGAASSVRHTRNDRVDFFTSVSDANRGLPLRGTLKLRLIGNKPVTYSGTFYFIVAGSEGTVFTDSVDKNIVLKPKAGHRAERMKFRFDLPSGDYAVRARFEELTES